MSKSTITLKVQIMENYDKKKLQLNLLNKINIKETCKSDLTKQQHIGGLERWPQKRTRQSCLLDKAWLTGCCLVTKDYNTMDFKCLLWIQAMSM